MSTNLGNYQATNEVLDDFSPIPPGTYLAMVKESALVQNAKTAGNHIKFKFVILNGEKKDRLVFEQITYTNNSSQAQQIGRKELNTLMAACRVAVIQDTTQLHGIPMLIDVTIKQDDGREPYNTIRNYHWLDPNQQQDQQEPAQQQVQQPAQQAAVQQPAQQVVAPADDTPSWAQ